MEAQQFRAKIIWFRDIDGEPMNYRRDAPNPDPKLRSRRMLGMSILSGLSYNPEANTWEDGLVYDSRDGCYWNALASITGRHIGKCGRYKRESRDALPGGGLKMNRLNSKLIINCSRESVRFMSKFDTQVRMRW